LAEKDKKLAVFHALSQEMAPISLPQLLPKLGSDYAERSVRRWLTELVTTGQVKKIGEKRGTLYQTVQTFEFVQSNPHTTFKPDSQKIIDHVRQPLYTRNPVSYNDAWLEAYQPNVTFYIPSALRLELQHIGKRSMKEEPAGTYAHQIFNRLLIDLSYNSSRLEGNTYSLLETQRLLLEGSSAEGKMDGEKIMILNHKEAIRYLVDQAPKLTVSEETIFTLHYLLSDGLIESRYSGKVRDHGVRIGGSTYLPFENKKDLELRLHHIMEKAASIQNPYEQSLFLLAHLSYLQSFIDVNKRTARISANIPLIKNNLVPLSFSDVERDDYNSAMIAVYELNNTLPLVDLYLFSYRRTATQYDITLKAVGFDEIRVRYRQQRRELLRHIILHPEMQISIRVGRNWIPQPLKGEPLKEYITSQAQNLIQSERDRPFFCEEVLEDLTQMDASRLAGLGVTSEQFYAWKKKQLS
jgi:Fic family protein